MCTPGRTLYREYEYEISDCINNENLHNMFLKTSKNFGCVISLFRAYEQKLV